MLAFDLAAQLALGPWIVKHCRVRSLLQVAGRKKGLDSQHNTWYECYYIIPMY